MQIDKVYATTDFYLAAFLKAKGMKIVDTEQNGRRSTFLFENCSDTKSLVRDFYNDGLIKVNDFKNAIQDLKAMIYNL